MKLEEGMYVRTKHYGVFKILKVIKENNFIKLLKEPGHTVEVENKKYKYYMEEEITKYSHNIIDLIEVGDYVNGYKVIGKDSFSIGINLLNEYEQNWEWLCEEEIQSIVTKEQFESMSYKVGE